MSRGRPEAGWKGWDEYAPFYDWENARTVARRDVPFWRRLAAVHGARVLELGCGTGRLMIPVARTAARVVGIDRSAAMLAKGRTRLRRARLANASVLLGDITALPFRSRSGFSLVMAPYGMLQSLTRERDLRATIGSVHRVLRRGGLFVVDLVPDLPRWAEYTRHPSLTGRRGRGTRLTLIESVRQDRRRGLTVFDHEYVEWKSGRKRVHCFSLTFRTLSVPQMSRRLESAGFAIRAVLGDYRGGPWDKRSDVWVIVAEKA